MEISEIYNYADSIGVLTFSTIHNGEVHSRSAHFNGYDKDGIYFRTMSNKPFGRQLEATKKVTVCGCSDPRVIGHDEKGVPDFPISYTIRIIGEVRRVTAEEIFEKAKRDEAFKTAANDIINYPAMADGNYVIHKAKVEIFDVDFGGENRDNKVFRRRTSFGGAEYNLAGARITDDCIECGACFETCSFKAIKEGSPYSVIPEHCDDCGSCMRVCPADAILESLVF